MNLVLYHNSVDQDVQVDFPQCFANPGEATEVLMSGLSSSPLALRSGTW